MQIGPFQGQQNFHEKNVVPLSTNQTSSIITAHITTRKGCYLTNQNNYERSVEILLATEVKNITLPIQVLFTTENAVLGNLREEI